MWDLPGPGLEPMSPALEGGGLPTVPPGKSQYGLFFFFLRVDLFTYLFRLHQVLVVAYGLLVEACMWDLVP